MFDISPIQIIIVLAIALLIFGPKRLPDLGRGLGRGLRDFKSGITGDDADQRHAETTPTPLVAEPEQLIAESAKREVPTGELQEARKHTPAGV